MTQVALTRHVFTPRCIRPNRENAQMCSLTPMVYMVDVLQTVSWLLKTVDRQRN